jgi:hypothetical protein
MLRSLLFAGLLLPASLAVGAPPEIPPAKGEAAARVAPPKVKAGPVSPPVIDGPAEADYLLTFTVANVSDKAKVVWDWTPDDGGAAVKVGGCDRSLSLAGPPGTYRVTAFGVDGGEPFLLKRTAKITGGAKPDPRPDPKPGPDPKPDPKPDPEPAGAPAGFVVVEDTAKAGPWRGDILGSPAVAGYYKANNLKHRLISVGLDGADGALDPVAKSYVAAATGKQLPYLFVYDAKGKFTYRGPAALSSGEAFVAQLSGEAAHARKMGNIPPPENQSRKVFAAFGSAPNVPIIPRDKWKAVNLGVFLPPVHDQDGVGACNAFASITAVEAARNQAGLPYVALSPGFLYGAINGGSDQGSMLEDGLEWMTTRGTVKVSTIGYLDWRRGRSLMGNAAALAEAKSYRVIEAYECNDFDGMASALQQGFFIIEGLMWFNNFVPDRDGWLPARGAGQAGGHALAGYGLVQRNGLWGIRTRNSWGSSWGIGGDCVIPESLFDGRIGGFWAVRAVVQTPDAPPTPAARIDPFRRVEFALAW